MNNNEHCKHLEEYLHGEISDADRSAFESHLLDCLNCCNEIQETDRVDDLIRDAWSGVVSPKGLTNFVFPSDGAKKKWWQVHRSTIAAVAATVILVASLTFFVTRPDVRDNKSAEQTGPESVSVTESIEIAKDPVVTFHQTGSGNDAILVSSTDQQSNFTIVHAYRPISDPNIKNETQN